MPWCLRKHAYYARDIANDIYIYITFYVGQYETASAQKDCTLDSLITTKDDCEKAAGYLGYEFLKDMVIPARDVDSLPSNCIWDIAGYAFFNQPYSKPGANNNITSTTVGAICKIKGRN